VRADCDGGPGRETAPQGLVAGVGVPLDKVMHDEHVRRAHRAQLLPPEPVRRGVPGRGACDDALEEADRLGERASSEGLDPPYGVVVDDEPRARQAAVEHARKWAEDRRVLCVDDVGPPLEEDYQGLEEEGDVAHGREVPRPVEEGDADPLSAHSLGELIGAKSERDPKPVLGFSLTHPSLHGASPRVSLQLYRG